MAAASIRGARIARSTTKRLCSSGHGNASSGALGDREVGGGAEREKSRERSKERGGLFGGKGKVEHEDYGYTDAEGREVSSRGWGKEKEKEKEGSLKLTFVPSPRLEILRKFLAAACFERNSTRFLDVGKRPSTTEVLEAIGWASSQTGGEVKNWEDEQWEVMEVKDDFRAVMSKGAKEWDRWCKRWEEDREKGSKK